MSGNRLSVTRAVTANSHRKPEGAAGATIASQAADADEAPEAIPTRFSTTMCVAGAAGWS